MVLKRFQANEYEFEKFFCKTLTIYSKDSLDQKIKTTQNFIKQQKLHYPLILKPDDGIGGIGLQFIEDEKKLIESLESLKKDYILQEYVSRPLELSVFFIKHPSQQGKIWSITRRYTVKENNEPELMIPTRRIICKDESHLINPILEKRFNALSDIDGFYFGRFDIRVQDMHIFTSQWTWFKIIEVNVGAHSMALHAFDSKYGWMQRYKILSDQLKFAFDIAEKNRSLPWYPHQSFRDFLQWFLKIFIDC